MQAKLLYLPLLLFWAMTLTGCGQPETPQEVTRAFWQAVVENDAETATDLSTLVDENGYDAYSLNWSGAEASWGRVSVDEAQASIGTVFTGLPQMEGEALETTTYLVRINDQWQVDYHRTGDELRADQRLGAFTGGLRELGDALRSRFADESGRAVREIDRLADELAGLTDQTRRELSSLLEHYGEDLEHRLDQFSRALEEALEQNPEVSSEDRQTIDQARSELRQQQQDLDTTEPESLAEASQALARIRQQLSDLSGPSFERLKEQLDQWSQELSRELEKLNQQARQERRHSI